MAAVERMGRLKWWTPPLVLGLAGAAMPVVVQGWMMFADPQFSSPIALKPGASVSRDITVRMDDFAHQVKLEYDSPRGVMGGYCNTRMAFDPEMAMPDCATPPTLVVSLSGPGGSAITDGEPSCCQFSSGHPAAAARILARARLEPWRTYRLRVRVVAAEPALNALHPRIVVAAESYERDMLLGVLSLAAGALTVVLAAGWAALAFARRREDRTQRD